MRYNLVRLYFLLIPFLINGCYQAPKDLNPSFERELKESLKLQLIANDREFGRPYTEIFNDTLVGFNGGYFFVPLDNPDKKVKHRFEEIQFPNVTQIDTLHNGSIYFGKYGGSTMQTVSIDGQLNEYFKEYNNDVFYAFKIFLYKKNVIISSMNGVYIFNYQTQKLLWKDTSIDRIGDKAHSIVGNNLIFLSRIGKSALYSLNIDRLKINWHTTVGESPISWRDLSKHTYITNKNAILLRDKNKLFLKNATSGDVIWSKRLNLTHLEGCHLVGDDIYVSLLKDDVRGLIYINSKNNKVWTISGANYWGSYHGKVIGFNDKDLFIIEKSTGKLLRKIKLNSSKGVKLRVFPNNYLLVNDTTLYK